MDNTTNMPLNISFTDLKGKRVMITGTNRGIGTALAEAFLNNGCSVVATHRENKSVLKNTSSKIYFLQTDVTDIGGITKWLNDYEENGNTIDILVNNAAVCPEISLFETTALGWDSVFDTNLKATFFLSQLMACHMKKNGGGVIINACSFAATIPSANYGVYAASKAALRCLTKSMAAEWAPFNIRVNAYSPGVVETEMTKPKIEKEGENMRRAICLNRFGTMQEIANGVLFLASDVSQYVTGIDLDLSGGKFVTQNPSVNWL